MIDGTSVSVTLAVPREDPHQSASAYFNDFGFPYGYAKGGAGFGGAGMPNNSPFPGRVSDTKTFILHKRKLL